MTASPALPAVPAVPPSGLRSRAPAELPPPAVRLVVERLSRRWSTVVAGCPVVFQALEPVTLDVGRGEWIALAGAGDAGVTLLRCIAGLVRPDAGRVRWLDAAGRPALPPRLAMVHAGREHARALTVGDVVHAVAARLAGPVRATVRTRVALVCCGLAGARHRPLRELPALDRWRTDVAAALAGGAEWLLLELPPIPEASAPEEAAHEFRRLQRALAGLGVSALVAAAGTVPFPVSRRVVVRGAVVEPMLDAAPFARQGPPRARVAEASGPCVPSGVASPHGPA